MLEILLWVLVILNTIGIVFIAISACNPRTFVDLASWPLWLDVITIIIFFPALFMSALVAAIFAVTIYLLAELTEKNSDK